MTVRRAVPVLVAIGCAHALVAPAAAQTPEPYRDPPFTCTVVDYGTDPPELPAPPQDPLCVRYDKTNITVSTLGVVDFLAAEPGRVAIVAGKCSYWQQDHWVVRASPDTAPVVSWEGSYWYDAPSASAGGILRNLHVAGQPADGTAFIAALRPLIGDEAADALEPFADDGGGGGATFALPEGFGGDPCASSDQPPAPGGTDAPAGDDDGDSIGAAPGSPPSSLPSTGGVVRIDVVLGLLALALLVRRLQGGWPR